MAAYVDQRRRSELRRYNPGRRVEAFPLEAARDWLREALPRIADWTPLEEIAPEPGGTDAEPSRASYVASTLSAGLELVKEGALDVRQEKPFDPLYLKRRGLGQPLELTP